MSSCDCVAIGWRNIRLMHLLERLALEFEKAGIPLIALKGGALNVVVYDRPDERPMDDIDLLVRRQDAMDACDLLQRIGGQPSTALPRPDHFPRFGHHRLFRFGGVLPVPVELHASLFGPRYFAKRVDEDDLWKHSRPVRIGRATVRILSDEHMLIHLAAHSAFHGNARSTWAEDIRRWADARRDMIDWDRFLKTVAAWGLALPVKRAVAQTEQVFGAVLPDRISRRLAQMGVSRRDRLVLHLVTRDPERLLPHLLADCIGVLSGPEALAYVRDMLLPDSVYIREWHGRHCGREPSRSDVVGCGGLASMHLRRWANCIRHGAAGLLRLIRGTRPCMLDYVNDCQNRGRVASRANGVPSV